MFLLCMSRGQFMFQPTYMTSFFPYRPPLIRSLGGKMVVTAFMTTNTGIKGLRMCAARTCKAVQKEIIQSQASLKDPNVRPRSSIISRPPACSSGVRAVVAVKGAAAAT